MRNMAASPKERHAPSRRGDDRDRPESVAGRRVAREADHETPPSECLGVMVLKNAAADISAPVRTEHVVRLSADRVHVYANGMASGATEAEHLAAGSGARRFELGSLDWRRVDPGLVRSLLRAIDKSSDAGQLRRAFAELAGDPSERDVLARAAAEMLGRGGIRRALWDRVIPVLVAEWLPGDDGVRQIDRLARDGLSVLERARWPSSRALASLRGPASGE